MHVICVIESTSSQGQISRGHGRVISIPTCHSRGALSNVGPEAACPDRFHSFPTCLR